MVKSMDCSCRVPGFRSQAIVGNSVMNMKCSCIFEIMTCPYTHTHDTEALFVIVKDYIHMSQIPIYH